MRQIAKPRYSGEPESRGELVSQPRDGGRLSHHGILADSDELIRKMMAEQRREHNLRSLPDIMPDLSNEASGAECDAAKARQERRQAWGKALNETPANHFDEEEEEADQPRRGIRGRLFPRKRKFEAREPAPQAPPKRGLWVALSFATIVFFQPMLIPGLLMATFWILFVASLMFGPGRVVDFLQGLWGLLMRHNPVLATKIRDISDTIVLWGLAVLNRLPGKLGNRLSQSDDVAEQMDPDEDLDDAFDRRLQAEVFRG